MFRQFVRQLKHNLGLCYKARMGYNCHGRRGECDGGYPNE